MKSVFAGTMVVVFLLIGGNAHAGESYDWGWNWGDHGDFSQKTTWPTCYQPWKKHCECSGPDCRNYKHTTYNGKYPFYPNGPWAVGHIWVGNDPSVYAKYPMHLDVLKDGRGLARDTAPSLENQGHHLTVGFWNNGGAHQARLEGDKKRHPELFSASSLTIHYWNERDRHWDMGDGSVQDMLTGTSQDYAIKHDRGTSYRGGWRDTARPRNQQALAYSSEYFSHGDAGIIGILLRSFNTGSGAGTDIVARLSSSKPYSPNVGAYVDSRTITRNELSEYWTMLTVYAPKGESKWHLFTFGDAEIEAYDVIYWDIN